MTDDEEFTLTGLGGDVNKQTLEVCGDRALRKLEGVARELGASLHQESSPVHSTTVQAFRCISV